MTTSKHLARYLRLDKALKCLRNLWSNMQLKRLLHTEADGMDEKKSPKERVTINRQGKARI
jgi:hypothetical protein